MAVERKKGGVDGRVGVVFVDGLHAGGRLLAQPGGWPPGGGGGRGVAGFGGGASEDAGAPFLGGLDSGGEARGRGEGRGREEERGGPWAAGSCGSTGGVETLMAASSVPAKEAGAVSTKGDEE